MKRDSTKKAVAGYPNSEEVKEYTGDCKWYVSGTSKCASPERQAACKEAIANKKHWGCESLHKGWIRDLFCWCYDPMVDKRTYDLDFILWKESHE